jgi:hypothetical protein
MADYELPEHSGHVVDPQWVPVCTDCGQPVSLETIYGDEVWVHVTPAPKRAKCTFEWRCQDCTDCGTGDTMADVQAKALVHYEAMRAFTHRVQVCGWNGWHRP